MGAEHTQSTWTVCAYINAHLWGMRMDYTLVSTSLATRIAAATILGRIDRGVGHGFYGSDHCPIMLELSEADGAEGEAADAAGGHGEAEDRAAAAPEEYSDEDDELREHTMTGGRVVSKEIMEAAIGGGGPELTTASCWRYIQ